MTHLLCPCCGERFPLQRLAQWYVASEIEWWSEVCTACGESIHLELVATPTGTARFSKRQRLRRRPA